MGDLSSYRQEFPVWEHSVYFNHAGVAPASTRVRDAVGLWMNRLVERGLLDEHLWEDEVEDCRTRFANLVRASQDEIAFVRNTSHGLSLVAAGLDWREGDRVAVASHKWLLGIPGIGALYADRDVIDQIRPALVGWKSTTDAWNFDRAHFELLSDARKFEEGSPPYALIAGFRAALVLLEEVGIPAVTRRSEGLIGQLAEGLHELGADVAPLHKRRHHMVTFTHPTCDGAGLLTRLSEQGFVLSQRRGRVRVSPHFYNTEEEIHRLIEAVAEAVKESANAAGGM